MVAAILHSTDELKLIKFQKELISELFEEGRILLAVRPLWIKLSKEIKTLSDIVTNHNSLTSIELKDIKVSDSEIFIPVNIFTDTTSYHSKLTLILLHSGSPFSEYDKQKLAQKKQPVKQLKVFRLGLVQDEGSHAQSISKSVWCKIK